MLEVPNQIIYDFVEENGGVLFRETTRNKIYLWGNIMIPVCNDAVLSIDFIYEINENYFQLHQHEIDYWLGEKNITP